MTISLVSILVTLIVVGLLLYIIQLLPLDAIIKKVAYIVVLVFVLLWLVSLLGGGPVIRIG
jgi:hypothetical protein